MSLLQNQQSPVILPSFIPHHFRPMLQLPLLDHQLNIQQRNGRASVFDPVRKRWVVLTPEEHVRQLLLLHLLEIHAYPLSLIAVEKGLMVGTRRKRFDLVVYGRHDHQPWLLAECKAPDVPLTESVLHQLLDYHNQLQGRYWLITNGHQHFCADAADAASINWLQALPAYDL